MRTWALQRPCPFTTIGFGANVTGSDTILRNKAEAQQIEVKSYAECAISVAC